LVLLANRGQSNLAFVSKEEIAPPEEFEHDEGEYLRPLGTDPGGSRDIEARAQVALSRS
jgi:hypothetical protein